MNLDCKQNMPFSGPLFIVGMPRSGTKLLRDLLNNHSLIAIPDIETRMLPTWVHNWERYGDLSKRPFFKLFYNETVKLSYFRYMKDRGQLIPEESWYSICRDFSPSGVFEALVRHDAKAEYNTTLIWGDKSPLYFRHVSLLKELFPAAKFIHIIRDVRDYCLSINKAWGKSMIRAAQRWADDVYKFKVLSRDLGDSIIEIKFEDLITEPEPTLKMICDFLGIEFQEQMLSLARPSENIGDAKGLNAIMRDNHHKYSYLMDPGMCRKIEMVTSEILRSYAYEVDYPGAMKRVNKIKLLGYKILDGVNLFIFDTREYGFFNCFERNLYSYMMKR